MTLEDRVTSIIGQIYEAVEDETAWPSVLLSLSDCFGGAGCGFTVDNARSGRTSVSVSARLDPYRVREYNEHYHTVDLFTSRSRSLAAAGRAFASHTYLTDAELGQSEFYNDFLRKHPLFYNMAGSMSLDEGTGVYLTLLRAKRARPFSQGELDLLDLLLPHFRRAARLGLSLRSSRTPYQALDRLRAGVIFVDSAGKVTFANAVAAKMSDDHDGLHLTPNGLTLASPAGRRDLARLRALAATESRQNGNAAVGVLAVTRPSGRRPYLLRVSPLRALDLSVACENATIVILITDLEESSGVDSDALRVVFGLTPAECRLAALLAEGDDLTEASEQLSITRNTVRAQLRSIFEKTGVRRQAELVALISRLAQGTSPYPAAPAERESK